MKAGGATKLWGVSCACIVLAAPFAQLLLHAHPDIDSNGANTNKV